MKRHRTGLRSAAATTAGFLGLGLFGLLGVPAASAAPTISPAVCQAYQKVGSGFENSKLFTDLEASFIKAGKQPTAAQITAAVKNAFGTKSGFALEKQLEGSYIKFYATYGSQLPQNLQGDAKVYANAAKQFNSLSYSQYKSIFSELLSAENLGGSQTSATGISAAALKKLPSWLRKVVNASQPLSVALATC